MFKVILLFSIFFLRFDQPDVPLKINANAPDVNLLFSNGENIPLSSFKGAIVYIDFWASWCIPSRKLNASLSKIKEKYRTIARRKGLAIVFINISLDTNKELWHTAALKDNIGKEKNVCDLSGWESPIVKGFQLTRIPSSYLIDTDGKIISKDIWDERLDSTLDKVYSALSN